MAISFFKDEVVCVVNPPHFSFDTNLTATKKLQEKQTALYLCLLSSSCSHNPAVYQTTSFDDAVAKKMLDFGTLATYF